MAEKSLQASILDHEFGNSPDFVTVEMQDNGRLCLSVFARVFV